MVSIQRYEDMCLKLLIRQNNVCPSKKRNTRIQDSNNVYLVFICMILLEEKNYGGWIDY